MAEPAAMEYIGLSKRIGAGFDPCAALQVAIELDPGETSQIICMLGQAETVSAVRQLVTLYRESHALEAALSRTCAWWDQLLSAVELNTPERATDFLVNRWLLYQSLSCRIWARSAFYQSGGAYGFRDQLQDVLALLYARPELARAQILLAASRQFRQGDIQHWWHPPTGAGIRSRISDDLLWLPYVVAQYVKVTGDLGVLKEDVPFLNAPELDEDQHEVFLTPEDSGESASLFEHCRRAVARGLAFGPHGLPLIGTGDWNDGMNRVGAEGRGESVWLAWFLADVLEGMAELSEAVGQPDLGRSYTEQKESLVQQVEQHAWDGAWYLRATHDDGTPLGSAANEEGQIDSLPQSWAHLSGVADKERAAQALESAWQHLVHKDDGLVLLFTPPFDRIQPSPGYIQGYPPGVRENGGQYTHAAVWLAMAMARKGDGTRAVQLLRMLNPIENTATPERMQRYGVEPYAVAADVYALNGHKGRGGWSWYTGSAAWMYRAWIEEILGLRIRGDHMRIEPAVPAAWTRFSLRYRHGEAVYDIEVENPDGCEHGVLSVEMDGRHLPDARIPLHQELIKHRIKVRMGRS
jgi:cyclic beta-1,2-glucan synthetase